MDALVRTYDGEDLVIPRKEIEELGLKPGDKVVIRPEIRLVPRKYPPEELERRRKILDELAGSWTAQDEEAFRRNREEMWATWQPRNWS
jgi:bifunctional DNA-binding transcriptional regulator/antitoxin component of YhaV-PrlF toxin-antitoxin module